MFLCFFVCFFAFSFYSVRARWVERSTEIGARDGTGRTLRRFAFSREEGRGETGSCGWFCRLVCPSIHRSIHPFIHHSGRSFVMDDALVAAETALMEATGTRVGDGGGGVMSSSSASVFGVSMEPKDGANDDDAALNPLVPLRRLADEDRKSVV